MELWIEWFSIVWQLREAFSRFRTFMWFIVALLGITIRIDLFGVTSIIRALGLKSKLYDNLLDFFHSKAVKTDKLTIIWAKLVFAIFSPLRINGRYIICGDGIKVGKEGKKMPAVKYLHQESESNNKAEFIMGHSCQAIGLIVGALSSFFCVPLTCRIHEGLIFSNRDKRTLLDKMVLLLNSLLLTSPCYFVADAYYASKKTISGLLKNGHHLISRMKKTAVAYYPAIPKEGKNGKGRPKKYGKKVKLTDFFKEKNKMKEVESPVYGEKNVKIFYMHINLLWKPTRELVRFVIVIHPYRGKFVLMSTDLTLDPVEMIKIYGLRFKIEVSFKQAIHTLGTFRYHFWSKDMKPITRKSGNQYLHRETKQYRDAICRKLSTYHNYIQMGIIAQGLLQYLSSTFPNLVWASFGSWIRTIRPGICPSELVTSNAMKNSFPAFFVSCNEYAEFTKFLAERIDYSRSEGLKLAG